MNEFNIVATYDYVDEAGTELLFQVVRTDPKSFRQRRPVGDDQWVWNLDGVRRVLYWLDALQGKDRVVIVEGEKDVDRLWALGIPATTSPCGAGKWKPEYADQLVKAGVRSVVLIPDNDVAGTEHAQDVAKSCLSVGISVKLLKLPGLLEKGDVSDWLDGGGTADELRASIKASPHLRRSDFSDKEPEPVRTKSRKDIKHDPTIYREKLNLPKMVRGTIAVPCPFHVETKPSFYVDFDKGVFFCHGGCSKPKGGGPAEFLMKWVAIKEGQKITKDEAKKLLKENRTCPTNSIQRTPVPPKSS